MLNPKDQEEHVTKFIIEKMSVMKIKFSTSALNDMSINDKLKIKKMIESIEQSSQVKRVRHSEKKELLNETNKSFDS